MFSLTSLLAFAALVAAQTTDPSIATPAAVVQCQPAQISFVATHTPVFISIIPGGQPSAAALEDLGSQTASPFTWDANLPGGTYVTLQIRDSTGAVAYSAPFTIQTSTDSSCIGASASSSGAASASQTAASSSSAAVSSASTSAAVSSSVAVSTSSVIQSVSSAVSSVSTATAPATTTRASSAAESTSRTATATSATRSATTSANSARSNMQVGFAGFLGLAAAVVIA